MEAITATKLEQKVTYLSHDKTYNFEASITQQPDMWYRGNVPRSGKDRQMDVVIMIGITYPINGIKQSWFLNCIFARKK